MKPSVKVVVSIEHDDAANVWLGQGLNLKGLLVEADTLDDLRRQIIELIPHAVEMNGLPEVGFELTVSDSQELWHLPVSPAAIDRPTA